MPSHGASVSEFKLEWCREVLVGWMRPGNPCVMRGDGRRFSISKWRDGRCVIAVSKCIRMVSKCKCNADTKEIGYNLVLMEYRYETGKRFLAIR